jgi:hypothetical protein
LFLDISSASIDTFVPSLYQCVKTCSIFFLSVVSAIFAPLFQPVCHQRNVANTVVNRFSQQTLPTINRKHFFMNIIFSESFCPQKLNRMLLFSSPLLKHDRYFDYQNQPLNMHMRVCYLDCAAT